MRKFFWEIYKETVSIGGFLGKLAKRQEKK